MSHTEMPAWEVRQRVSQGELTAVEVAEEYLRQIELHDDQIGAFLSYDPEQVLRSAREVDRRIEQGEAPGLLAGVPVAIKDNLCDQGERTTCASRMLESFRPPYTATAVARLREQGAVILGRTNLDEFAMGSSTENSAFQVTRNPWNADYAPGGSSGGSAACVAARMAPLSLGSDTGGSIRQPAALCGVVGMKPTYGRVSRYGLVAFASSLDQIGPFGRCVRDVALALSAIAGPDPRDSTCASREVEDYSAALDQPRPPMRIGVVREHFEAGLDDEVRTAVETALDVLKQQGATLCDVSLPHSRYAIATYYLIAPCEASSNLARFDGAHYGHRTQAATAAGSDSSPLSLTQMYERSRAEGFGSEVKRRIMLGTYALSAGYYDAYYLKAMKVRRLIQQDYDQVFAEVDVLVGPTTPTAAFRLGDKTQDPLSMYLEDLYTVSANLAGIPGLSLPCGFTSRGLPIGLQFQGPAFCESRLLQAAHAFQSDTTWHTRSPVL